MPCPVPGELLVLIHLPLCIRFPTAALSTSTACPQSPTPLGTEAPAVPPLCDARFVSQASCVKMAPSRTSSAASGWQRWHWLMPKQVGSPGSDIPVWLSQSCPSLPLGRPKSRLGLAPGGSAPLPSPCLWCFQQPCPVPPCRLSHRGPLRHDGWAHCSHEAGTDLQRPGQQGEPGTCVCHRHQAQPWRLQHGDRASGRVTNPPGATGIALPQHTQAGNGLGWAQAW